MDMAEILCNELNESFDDFVKECLNVDKNEFFNIKPDAYYKRYFQWGVKRGMLTLIITISTALEALK